MIPLSDENPTHRFPIITILLIVVNVVVFVLWQAQVGLQQSVLAAGFVPGEFTADVRGHALNLFTAMFMHGGIMHLLGNMWFLWIFGDNVENDTGPFRFLIFYLLTGVVATLAHTYTDPRSLVPLVGASGAISGVLGAYLVRHPQARVRTLIPLGIFTQIVHVPAFMFLFVWIGMQVLSQAATRAKTGGGVAYLAHIGGFIAGVVLISLFASKRRAATRRRFDRDW